MSFEAVVDECIVWALGNKPGNEWLLRLYGDWYSPYYSLMYRLASVLRPRLC
jgi:hypothetical protein